MVCPQQTLSTTFTNALSLCHIAFFCYGCKDPNVAALSFEHVPMIESPHMGGGGTNGDYHEVRSVRSRSNTGDMKEADLVDIDLGKKVKIIKLQPISDLKDRPLAQETGTPPKTPSDEAKRFGLVGLPPRLATPTTEQRDPFLKTQANDWI